MNMEQEVEQRLRADCRHNFRLVIKPRVFYSRSIMLWLTHTRSIFVRVSMRIRCTCWPGDHQAAMDTGLCAAQLWAAVGAHAVAAQD